MIGTVLGNVYGVTLRIDVGTKLGSLYGYFDGSDDSKFKLLLIGYSLGSTDFKVLGYGEGIKLGYTDGKVFGTLIGNVCEVTLTIDIGKNMGALNGSFDCSIVNKLKGLLLGESLDLIIIKCLALKKTSNW